MKSKILLSLLLSGSITCFAQGYKDGIEYYKVSEYDNAKELLERNLNDASTNKSEAFYYLGCVALENGNTAAAKDYFQKGQSAGSCQLNLVGLGQIELKAGNKKAAEENFSLAIKNSPKKDAKILVAIARAYYEVDGVKYAKEIADYIKKARKNNKVEADTPILEGDMAAAEDKTGDAQGMYDEAISYDPTKSEPYVKYARALFKVSPQQAISRLQDLLQQNPTSALAQRELAEKYYENDQWTKAAEQYGEYIKNPNHFKQDEVRYASLLFYGKKYQESLDLARQIEASLPATDKNVFYMKRLQLYNLVAMEDWAGADEAAKALFAMNVPAGAKYEVKDYTDYADALKKLGRTQEALALRVKAYEANPDKLDLLKDLSDGYSDAEDYVNSAKYYQMFVDKGDYKTNDLFVLSKKYFYVAAYDSVPESKAVAVANALKYVDMVNEKMADNVRMQILVNLHKAKVLQVSEVDKKEGKAVDTYKKVLELLDQDPANLADRKDDYILAYNYLANYYFATGDKETMKGYYIKWLEADPGNDALRKYVEGLSK
ncbi:MAG: hypothetical protein U0L43_00755 [Muribaculaceae bacterium]|nr:hypothetical protein [Muribaculaceae bacterium]